MRLAVQASSGEPTSAIGGWLRGLAYGWFFFLFFLEVFLGELLSCKILAEGSLPLHMGRAVELLHWAIH